MEIGRDFQVWRPTTEKGSPLYSWSCEEWPNCPLSRDLVILVCWLAEVENIRNVRWEFVWHSFVTLSAVLKTIYWLIGSQWSSASKGVAWECFGLWWIRHMAATRQLSGFVLKLFGGGQDFVSNICRTCTDYSGEISPSPTHLASWLTGLRLLIVSSWWPLNP